MKTERIYRGNIPFVRLLLFLILGILFGYLFEPNVLVYRCLLGVIWVSFLLITFVKFSYKRKQYSYSLGILFFLSLFFIGWVLQWKGNPQIEINHFSHFETEVLSGVINDEPKSTGEYIRFEFKIRSGNRLGEQIPMTGLLLVSVKRDTLGSRLEYGDVLMIPSLYQEISPPFNPNSFDYKAYLANKMIWHSSFIERNEFKLLSEYQGNSIIQYALEFRQRMLRKFDYYLPDKSSLQIASALVLGYRNKMDKEVLNAFSATGTIHVLSVSGLHVGIVFVVFSTLLFWMNLNPKVKFLKGIVLIVLIWLYALITGFSPSVLRAAIMISFVLIALHFIKGGNIYNTIAASAFILLLYNPKFISDIGFQLSYLAVIAIIYLYPKIRDMLVIKNRLLRWIWQSSALSISAQLITFPLILFYFNTFPLYFLPANLFIILPATFIVYLGFALLIVPDGFLVKYIAVVLNGLIGVCKSVLEWFSQLPFATLDGFSINSWQVLLIYVFLGSLVFAFIMKKKQFLYGAFFVLILLSSSRINEYFQADSQAEVRFYNVNRHLAIGLFIQKEYFLYADSLFMNNKNYHYLLESIQLKNRGVAVKVLSFPNSHRGPNVLVENNIIQLADKRVFILDEKFEADEFIVVDVLLIRSNLKVDLQSIRKVIHFKKLLLDGSSYDPTIKEYAAQAEKLFIPYYILKNNFAYVW